MIKLPLKLTKAYETDASQLKGILDKVIIPEKIEEVQKAVRDNSKITIRGAGTGLVGGSVPNGTVIIDLSKLNKITNFNSIRKTIEVEAGVVLDDLNQFLERYGLEFPVNPSSHEVCTLGGMIATDAVGSRAIKYGKTSNWIEWLEIIDSQGRIQKKLKSEITDFSGLEGISGVIIKASLRLSEKKERTASIIEKDSIGKIIEKVKELKRNSNVSMIEFYGRSVSNILGLSSNYHLIVEFESNEGEKTNKEYQDLLRIRDQVYPLLAQASFSKIEDPKLFLDKIPELIFWLEHNNLPVFGHISVGILHPCFSKETENKIPEMIKIVKRLSGQISGEHGIGLIKKQYVEPQDKNLLKILKKRIDPSNKFNPGKVID